MHPSQSKQRESLQEQPAYPLRQMIEEGCEYTELWRTLDADAEFQETIDDRVFSPFSV